MSVSWLLVELAIVAVVFVRCASCPTGGDGAGVTSVGSGWAMDLIRAKDVMGLPVVSIAVVRIVTDQGPIEADRLRALGAHALVVEEAKS